MCEGRFGLIEVVKMKSTRATNKGEKMNCHLEAFIKKYVRFGGWACRKECRIFLFSNQVIFIGITVLLSVSSSVAAQSSSESRIVALEHTILELQQRVSVLEAQIQQPASVSQKVNHTGNSTDVKNWRQLRSGMSEQAVEDLLGTPGKVNVYESFIKWYYNYPRGGNITFDPHSRTVTAWSEP